MLSLPTFDEVVNQTIEDRTMDVVADYT